MAERKQVDWEAVERVTARVLGDTFGGPEAGVINELLFLLEEEKLASAYGWPAIIRAEREFAVPRGRIDLMLFHEDGSGTVIECKPFRTSREILPAIGQVMSYAVQLGYSRTLTKIRMAIASRVSAVELRPISPVLKACGVEPIFCGQFEKWACAFTNVLRSESVANQSEY